MKISVVIPLYNKKATVLRALNSVLNQIVLPEEIIVVNDGSTDDSELVVANLDHPMVRLIHQPNAGVSAARNKGIKEATGEWIAFLDADDEWLPGYLETIIDLNVRYNDAKFLATAYYRRDHKGLNRKVILNRLHFTDNGILDNYFEVAVSSEPPVNSSAVVVNKKALELIGGFPKGVKSGEDLLTWARLAVHNKLAYSTFPLSVFNQDAAYNYNEKPNRLPQDPDIVGRELTALAKHMGKIPGLKRYAGNWYKMRASIYYRLGMRRRSLAEIIKSLKLNPFNGRLLIYTLLLLIPTSAGNYIFRKFGRA